MRLSYRLPALLLTASMGFAAVAEAQTVATVRLDPEDDVSFGGSVGAAPGVGFVAVWSRGRIVSGAFGHRSVTSELAMVTWLGPDGAPATPLRPLDTRDDDVVAPLAVASAAPGEAVVALLIESNGSSRIDTQRIGLDGSKGPRSTVEACSALQSVRLLPAGDGYWLVWFELCDGSGAIRARRIARSGEAVGETITVTDSLVFDTGFAAAAGPGDGFWVVWTGAGGRLLTARRYLAGGTPATADVAVRRRPLRDPAVAALPDGAALVGWKESQDVLVRRLEPDGALAGAPQDLGIAGVLEFLPRLAASPAGIGAALWCRRDDLQQPASSVLRLFDAGDVESGLERKLDTSCHGSDELAFGTSGTLLVLAHEDVPTGPLTLDLPYPRPRIVVLPAAELVPPPGPGFVPNAFPGFRFWVRIGGDEPDPRIGEPELLCLPETSCVSGALAGRTEVLLRIVGPKPNGYLWPTVVRFTTSTVELWVEQLATGERRYYRLVGAAPGSDDLTGFFDRRGFLP